MRRKLIDIWTAVAFILVMLGGAAICNEAGAVQPAGIIICAAGLANIFFIIKGGFLNGNGNY